MRSMSSDAFFIIRQVEDLEPFWDGRLYPSAQIRCALMIFFDQGIEPGWCVGARVGIEDGWDVSGDALAHIELGPVGLCVLLKMELTTLPRRCIEDGLESGESVFEQKIDWVLRSEYFYGVGSLLLLCLNLAPLASSFGQTPSTAETRTGGSTQFTDNLLHHPLP